MSKILITGGSGNVGRSIESVNGIDIVRVSTKDADLTDKAAVKHLLTSINPDSIIHLAALSGGRQLSSKRPADLLLNNSIMASNLLSEAQKMGIMRIGLALSGACYASVSSRLAKESEFHDAAILEDDYSYAYSKRYLEVAMRAFNSQFGMNIYSFVINGVIGLEMNYSPEKALMIPSLIQKISSARDHKDPIEVWGDGSPKRQYTWSQDIVRNIFWCHENQPSSTILNIGTNEVVTVAECAILICQNFGIDASRLNFDISKGNGKATQLTDNANFIRLSGFRYENFHSSIEKICYRYKQVFA